ncbi:hypothetical protein L810_8682 [Burkholderia sp. AU4i]|nr:hypothetical protein L810_8682 [Burkholderia sp. AU4i]
MSGSRPTAGSRADPAPVGGFRGARSRAREILVAQALERTGPTAARLPDDVKR